MANYRTTVILKTDIVDSTPRLSGQTQAEMSLLRRQHKQFIAETAAKHLGSVFEEEGDAYWMDFPSVTAACLSAIEMHQNLRSMQAGKGEKQRLAIRAVITVGDILHQGNDAMGMTMSLTARIEKVTPPDETYLSHAAWLTLNKAEVQTSYVDEFNFKGFSETEKIYKVDQKYRTRVLSNQYIVFTDAKGFTRFLESNSIEVAENFLIDCDNLINDVCDQYGGVIRQVVGDQYFVTFSDANQTLSAIETLCRNWRKIIERYKIGVAIGVHKGNLNVFRSFVHGDDINTTAHLTGLDKFCNSKRDKIFVVISGKVRNEFKRTKREGKFRKLNPERITLENYRETAREHGAFRFIIEDDQQG